MWVGGWVRPLELDLSEFSARLPRHRAALDLLQSWAVHVAKRVLEEPSPRLLALDRKYNPERDLKLIAKQFNVSLHEMETLARTYVLHTYHSTTPGCARRLAA